MIRWRSILLTGLSARPKRHVTRTNFGSDASKTDARPLDIIVIPVLNERDGLSLVREHALCDRGPVGALRIVVVADGSPMALATCWRRNSQSFCSQDSGG